MLRAVFLLFLFIHCNAVVWSQNHNAQNDSIKIYNNIEDFSKKTKTGSFVHRLIFRKTSTSKNSEPVIQVNRNLELGQDKVIRNINITTLDPFGYSESDTAKVPKNKLETFGNRMNLKTKEFTIRNFLMFKKNDVFDSLIIKESERLIRTQRYVRRVLIKPIPIENNPDSIDVSVRVLDSWSIFPTGSLSTSSGRLQLTDRNFGGFGHQVSAQYKTRFNENKNAYNFSYNINNIQNTFIRSTLLYDIDYENNYIKSIGFDRPFYSPYTKWAGGASIYQRFLRDSLPDKDYNYELQSFKYNIKDFWAGHSIPLYTKYKEQTEITNLRTSIRYMQQNYTEKPLHDFDTLGFYGSQKLLLASIGISSVNYVQDKFIYNYDIIEDIQVGKIFSITGGWNNRFGKDRTYLGAKFAFGKYTKHGYFSTNIEWGSYFTKSGPEQSAFLIEGVYFTKLSHLGNWKFRHFFNPELVIGYNRYPHTGDELYMEASIQGLNASKIKGTRRFHFAYQLQSYAPYDWNGFRFNPFINIEAGFIGDNKNHFLDPKMYSKLGVGVAIYNDYLVFNSIQLSIAYYPSVPDRGQSVIKTNSLRNHYFTLQSFSYSRPETVHYR